MKKILITGGTGFLGKNIQESFKKNNLEGIFLGKKPYDLTSYSDTQKLFNLIKPEIVVHAAANVGGIEYNKNNPAKLIRDNLKIGINVLDACVEFGAKNVYIISTCCAYPKYCPTPFKEEDLWKDYPEETNAPYGIAKKTIMLMAQTYRKQFGLKATSFILANLYGIYDTFDPIRSHVVPSLIKKFVDAKETNAKFVECFGTGDATRDLLNVKDAANAITKAVLAKFDFLEPINLGSNKNISIKELANLIKELVGFNGDIIWKAEGLDGQPNRLLDTSKAEKYLGWNAEIDLCFGLKEIINWYLENKK